MVFTPQNESVVGHTEIMLILAVGICTGRHQYGRYINSCTYYMSTKSVQTLLVQEPYRGQLKHKQEFNDAICKN